MPDTGDMALKNVTDEDKCPTVAEILEIPIYNYITLDANNYGYSGTEEYIIVNYVHPI